MFRCIHRCLLLLASALLLALPAHAREVVDMLGRTVAIPDHPARVFGAAPPATALLYTLAPDTLIGLNMPFPQAAKGLVPEHILSLPILGSTMAHGRQANLEQVLTLRPDLVVAWGGKLPPGADADKIAAQYARIGLPVVFVRLDTLDDWSEAYAFMGEVLGREARAEALGAYVRDALARVRAAVDPVPPAERPSVYYAEGPAGMATECDTSFHVEAIVLAGGRNVFSCTPTSAVGLEPVSLEQILHWQPQIIVSQTPKLAQTLAADPRWKDIPAVRDGRILEVPRLPFNWIDRPPAFTRALGIQWLARAFYPERFDLDLKAEARRFYALFLDVSLDDVQLDRVLTEMPVAGNAASSPKPH